MEQKRVDKWMLRAKNAIVDTGISEKGEIEKTFRGQISSFGAAVVMGSLKSAVAFFSDKGDSDIDRQNLLLAMYYVINDFNKEQIEKITPEDVFAYVCENNTPDVKEDFIDASIAIKLAMNFFDLKEEKKGEKS